LLPVAAGAEDEALFEDVKGLTVDGALLEGADETGDETGKELEAGIGAEDEAGTGRDEAPEAAGAAPPPS